MRLIDADRLETILSETVMIIIRNPKMDNQEAYVRAAFDTFGKMIHNAPIIDAVPVKHGEWEKYDTYKQTIDRTFDGWCECSECRTMYPLGFNSYNYCPNCGAKMDGGKDDAAD